MQIRRRFRTAIDADWALDGPIPWRADDCALAGTVHLAATPPGPGVHGMCGYFAALRALAEVLR